jgi:hypothetical protein
MLQKIDELSDELQINYRNCQKDSKSKRKTGAHGITLMCA